MGAVVLKFLRTEAAGGMLLAFAAIAALFVANSSLAGNYFDLLKTSLTLDTGLWRHEATLKDWVKDGLMAIFFYVIGLELKRELTVGELSDPKSVLLPVAAALGGAIAPILIYTLMAGGVDSRGWPVPVATDIAFALAALAILAPHADPRLRLFLLTLAVVDDLLAIVLIAVLFTSNLALLPLLSAIALLGGLYLAGKRWTLPIWLYPLAGLITWGLAVEAGVHSSVMAVAAAMIVPPRKAQTEETLLVQLEHLLHPVSAFFVLPVFAFCAAGVSFRGLDLEQITGGVSAAVALALALGKPLGVASFTLAAAMITRTRMPFTPVDVLSVGCLCGIGFTMSLFIGALAFAGDAAGEATAQLGVLMGSSLSLLLAAVAFRMRPRAAAQS